MKKEELQQLQIQKLKILLRHAYENVPYYHESFKKNDFRPSDFNKLEDMQKIPVLQRSELRLKSEEFIAKNFKTSELISCKTSGTTATPVKFYRSKVDMTWDMAAELRGYGWAGYKTGAKLVYLRLFGPNDLLTSVKYRLERLANRWKLLGGYDLSEKSMASFCTRTRSFRPHFVLGGAGPTNIFAVFLLENGQYTIRPKAVFTYGETLLPHYRKTIEKAFNCKVYDIYGATEVAHIAAQCGCHEGHHVSQENVLVEIEKDGEIAVLGEEGKVLLTSLNGFAVPFIRYDIGDRGKMFVDDCSCGRGLSLFRPIGRTYEYFVHSDGTFTIFRDLQTIFEDLPIEDFQIVQQSYDEIVIKIVKRTGYTKAHTDYILKKVSLCISKVAKLRVELVDSVPLIGFGKVPHFVSKIPTKYT
jgi:phenylacetate-CoA ligase